MSRDRGPSRAVYRHSCPNCGGPNTEERLALGLPCPRCMPRPPGRPLGILEIEEELRRSGRLQHYGELARLERDSIELIGFFERAVGSRPWGAQRAWARRLVRGDSFSIVAPTGVGKTTFGIAASLFYACRGMKSYIVLPTTVLVIQAEKKALSMVSRSNCRVRILAIHSKMKRGERREAVERLERGEFDVLITTAAFARKWVDTVSRHRYRLVFVDDVDAVLKSARSVNVILRIAGFTEEDMELGMEALRLQRRRAALINRLSRLQSSARRAEEADRIRRELDEVEEKLRAIEERLRRARERVASLVVSTATGRPRGGRVRLFRSLLGFEAGGRASWGLRRVYDLYTYPSDGVYDRVAEIVASRPFRDGGLVFVPIDHGIEGAERLAEMLRRRGLIAMAYHSKAPPRILDAFASGEIEVLVGVANYYGTLVRGLDLPERVRYAVFAGVPRHRFPADIGEPHPARLIRLLSLLVEAPLEDIREEARRHMARLRDLLRRLSPAALHMITEKVLAGDIDAPGSPSWIVQEAYNFLRQALEEEDVWEYLSERSDVAIVSEDDKKYILIADVPTYIQASGRTSRLYAGGITRGVSVVVVDDERVFNGLVRRMRFYVETEWRRLEEADINALMREVDEDRERVRRLRKGEVEIGDLVRTALLIVESPNKARTIAGFFGQPSIRILPNGTRVYEVTTGNLLLSIAASGGHIYDLAPLALDEDARVAGADNGLDVFSVIVSGDGEKRYTPVYTSIKRCLECGYQYTADLPQCPVCGSERVKDGLRTVEDLRRVAWEVDTVLVGTDPDMEGEKIGWDIALLLRPYSRSIMRVEFHEITKRAILAALESPRSFSEGLVDAQVVRRIEDRWIGYTLSPILWCHFWPRYYCPRVMDAAARGRRKKPPRDLEKCKTARYYYNLSAGRVQTPVLGWVVKRTEEARVKVMQAIVVVNVDGAQLRAVAREDEIEGDKAELMQLYKAAKKGRSSKKEKIRPYGEVDVELSIEERKREAIPPPPPYTTDTLIGDASRYLGLGAPETMRLAQNLFEWGLITYHRTDSTRVSDKGIEVAREWIEERFGPLARRLHRPRTWGEGGAHEAIRPTRPIDADTLWNLISEGILEVPGTLTRNHLRLYDLIFRRFIASQMRDAIVEWTRYKIRVLLHNIVLRAEGITKIGEEGDEASKGFALVWPHLKVIPKVEPGTYGALLMFTDAQKVPLYTQGDLVLEMKRRGIGRPSTYAKIVDTLLRRAYISRPANSKKSGQVIATLRGRMVHKYLSEDIQYFEEDFSSLGERALQTLMSIPSLVSEERTRQLEEKMTLIETGETTREAVLNEIFREIEGLSVPISLFLRGRDRPIAGGFEECLSGSLAMKIAEEVLKRWG